MRNYTLNIYYRYCGCVWNHAVCQTDIHWRYLYPWSPTFWHIGLCHGLTLISRDLMGHISNPYLYIHTDFITHFTPTSFYTTNHILYTTTNLILEVEPPVSVVPFLVKHPSPWVTRPTSLSVLIVPGNTEWVYCYTTTRVTFFTLLFFHLICQFAMIFIPYPLIVNRTMNTLPKSLRGSPTL